MLDCGLPRSYWGLDESSFLQKDDTNIWPYIRRYLRLQKNRETVFGLYIFGGPYTGKTFVLSQILKNLLHEGFNCKYLTLERLVDLCFAPDKDFERTINDPDYLVLDNLDLPRTRKEAFLDVPLRALRLRRDCGRPILIGSRLTMEDLGQNYGDDARMYADQMCFPLEATGDFLRMNLERQELFTTAMEL